MIKPNQKFQSQINQKTDRIVDNVIRIMRIKDIIHNSHDLVLNSDVLSEFWGRSIFVYEYIFNLHLSAKQLDKFKRIFNKTLVNYCLQHKITTKFGKSTFITSEAWNHDGKVHINIACVINHSTFEYLKDIKRL